MFVQAVHNAADPAPGPEHPIQGFPIGAGLDLPGIGGAYGGHRVRQHQGRLHEVGLAVVFQAILAEVAAAQLKSSETKGQSNTPWYRRLWMVNRVRMGE